MFHNYRSILDIHRKLLAEFQARQIEQHPNFGMVSDLLLDAALNWNEAYLEYMPNYPLSKAKIDAEKATNPAFAAFLDECLSNPLSNRLDITHYTYRPIARLLRYPLLLREILASQQAVGPPDHPDIEAIPQIVDLVDNVGKAGQKGVAVNTAKVELWHLKTTLDKGKFSNRTLKELDLLNPMRELIHKGKVYRQPEGTITGAWSELHLLLFDNYFVLVKQVKVSSRHKDVAARYSINRRPVPLELLTMGDFSQPAQNRSLGLLKTIRGAGGREHEGEETQSDSRTVYPFTYSFIGQGSGQYTLWTDSAAARQEWQDKLMHAKVLRKEVNAAGQVFEFETLSSDTFYMAPYGINTQQNDEYTGRVTCSVPFVTVDGRSLIAVGCEQGVWIGVRKDPPSLRKVLHVRSVTHIAVLEEFGIFLVLADRSLLAYNIEALVPTAQSPHVRTAPERLSGVRDIVFFAVGEIQGRTLVVYVKRKGVGWEVYSLTAEPDGLPSPGTDPHPRPRRATTPTGHDPRRTEDGMVPRVQGILHPNGSDERAVPQLEAGDCVRARVRDHGPERHEGGSHPAVQLRGVAESPGGGAQEPARHDAVPRHVPVDERGVPPLLRDVRDVCQPVRRAQSGHAADRVGGHARECGVPPAIYPSRIAVVY